MGILSTSSTDRLQPQVAQGACWVRKVFEDEPAAHSPSVTFWSPCDVHRSGESAGRSICRRTSEASQGPGMIINCLRVHGLIRAGWMYDYWDRKEKRGRGIGWFLILVVESFDGK